MGLPGVSRYGLPYHRRVRVMERLERLYAIGEGPGANRIGYQLVWRFGADGGHAKLVWRLAVHTDGAGRTALSLRLEGRGSDMNARSRMLSSWTFLEELAESHTRRLARTVDDLVSAAEYDAGEEQPATRPRLLAAV